jgi:succinate-semialdehyde dehydrogenase/glutarate-semialdehyde dehydrogenase
VHESVAEEFGSKFAAKMGELKLGRGVAEGTTCGPVINQDAQDNMERLVAATISEGGNVLVGGESLEGDGYFFKPTVLDNVSADSTIWKEEIFGPIAPIVRFKNEEDAVRLANDTEYGLVASVAIG